MKCHIVFQQNMSIYAISEVKVTPSFACRHFQILITFSIVDLFRASSSTIAVDDVNAFNGLWHELRNQVMRVRNGGFEYSSWGDGRSLLTCGSCDSHDCSRKKKKKRKLIMYSPLGFCDREEFLDGFVRLFVLRRDAGE